VAISVPTVVGRAGAEKALEIELWPKESQGLKRSAAVLAETLGQVLSGATT
jgi:malate/lactate dehydrogenase